MLYPAVAGLEVEVACLEACRSKPDVVVDVGVHRRRCRTRERRLDRIVRRDSPVDYLSSFSNCSSQLANSRAAPLWCLVWTSRASNRADPVESAALWAVSLSYSCLVAFCLLVTLIVSIKERNV